MKELEICTKMPETSRLNFHKLAIAVKCPNDSINKTYTRLSPLICRLILVNVRFISNRNRQFAMSSLIMHIALSTLPACFDIIL